MSNNEPFGYSQELPENIREVFMWLCQDVASLRQKWDFYLTLFSDKENTDLFSDLARGSFRIIEESLRRDMTMAICRLSDPFQPRGQVNLSLNTLVVKLDETYRPNELLSEFLNACEPVRTLRNKRVGHTDLNIRIKPEDYPLPGIGWVQIERIVSLADQLLNCVYQSFADGELSFKTIYRGGADSLVYWLRKGRETEISRKKASLSGAT